MEHIYHKKTLIGIRVTFLPPKTSPITDPEEFVQVLTLKHPKGAYLLAHMHTPKRRTTTRLQECLVVKKGKIRIDLYGPDKKMFKRILLKEGQLFLLLNGGYGIHMMEDSELFEIKNGPFKEDKELI